MSSDQEAQPEEAPTTEKDVEAAWKNLTETINKYKVQQVLQGQLQAQQLQTQTKQTEIRAQKRQPQEAMLDSRRRYNL